MSVSSDLSRLKDTQLMTGTLLSAFCLVRTVRNEGQAIFGVLLCADETRVFNVGYNFYSGILSYTAGTHTGA